MNVVERKMHQRIQASSTLAKTNELRALTEVSPRVASAFEGWRALGKNNDKIFHTAKINIFLITFAFCN